MKSNLTLIHTSTIESKLLRMKELDNALKEIEAEYKMLRDEVIKGHFQTEEEYKTAKGLLLATYKSFTERRFNGQRFKADHPDIYLGYSEEKIVSKFLLK